LVVFFGRLVYGNFQTSPIRRISAYRSAGFLPKLGLVVALRGAHSTTGEEEVRTSTVSRRLEVRATTNCDRRLHGKCSNILSRSFRVRCADLPSMRLSVIRGY